MLDTGADVTIIAHSEWPANWPQQPVACMISGIGGVAVYMQRKHNVIIEGPEGKLATIRPFVDSKTLPPYANGKPEKGITVRTSEKASDVAQSTYGHMGYVHICGQPLCHLLYLCQMFIPLHEGSCMWTTTMTMGDSKRLPP
ncbi:hypothetical protein TURU_010647 [Turdus rufiventris]|nr:hypothetical protein TURU_010647 [Turdus rufiventris]